MFLIFISALTAAPARAATTAATPPTDENGVYVISTADDLAAFCAIVNGGDSGAHARLTNDVDLGGTSWTPIGASGTTPYSGTFDGGGHTISGLNVDAEAYAGLFGYVSGTVRNANVSGTVKGTVNNADVGGTGGIAGVLDGNGTVSGCSNYCTVSGSGVGYALTGGIVGLLNGDGTVTDCSNYGSVSGSGGIALNGTGGIVGVAQSGDVTNCSNYEYVSGKDSANNNMDGTCTGGIVGYHVNGATNNCANYGDVDGFGSSEIVYTGGVVGRIGNGSIANTSNSGTVTGTHYDIYGANTTYVITGGIVGLFNGATVTNCINSGSIYVSGGKYAIAGGVVGYHTSRGTAINCSNTNEVSCSGGSEESYVGGVIGMLESGAADDSVNSGKVSSTGSKRSRVGGVAGVNGGSVNNCGWLTGTAENGIGEGNGDTTLITDISSVVTSLTLSSNAVTVDVNSTAEITLTPAPGNSSSVFGASGAVRPDGVELPFAEPGIAEANYSDGKIMVTGLSEGETTLTVTVTLHVTDFSATGGYAADGTELTFSVPVAVSNVALKSITLDKTEASVKVGETVALTPSFSPSNASDKSVTWSSDDVSVATVDENGVVTGVGEGTAVVTATSAADENITASCTVKVSAEAATDPETPDEPVSPDKPQSTGGGGGGCSAGWGALSLLALVPLVARRKK